MRGVWLRRVFSFHVLLAPILIAAAIPFAFPDFSAHAGAWNKPAGEGQAILGAAALEGDYTFRSTGRLAKTPPYRKAEASLLVEYGITDWLQVNLKPAAESVSVGPPTRARISGLGDSEVGLQLRAFTWGTATYGLRATAIAPGHPGSRNPAAIGHARAGAQVDLVNGVSFNLGPWPSFIEGAAGLRLTPRAQGLEWRGETTFGVRPAPAFMVLLKSFTIISLDAPAAPLRRAASQKGQVSLVYEIDRNWSVEAGAFTTIRGVNALRERGLVASVWRRF